MSVIFIVLPLAIMFGAAALAAFIWATRRGQFDALDSDAIRAVQDDEPIRQAQSAPRGERRS